MASIIGTNPNQIPLNQHLGRLAHLDNVPLELLPIIPIANGGTGATTSIAALNNLRVFIQATTPASPQEGDLWFDIS